MFIKETIKVALIVKRIESLQRLSNLQKARVPREILINLANQKQENRVLSKDQRLLILTIAWIDLIKIEHKESKITTGIVKIQVIMVELEEEELEVVDNTWSIISN